LDVAGEEADAGKGHPVTGLEGVKEYAGSTVEERRFSAA
jgi:hypothetical protein